MIPIAIGVGAGAGGLAGLVMKDSRFGLFVSIVVSILGAVIVVWRFAVAALWLGGTPGGILTATVGAVVLLLAVALIRKAAR